MKNFSCVKKHSMPGILFAGVLLLTGCQLTQHPAEVNAVNTNTVHMSNNLFIPARIVIPAGQTVSWVNEDLAPHTVSSIHGKTLESGTIAPGQSYSHTFNQRGVYSYTCHFHPNMRGMVEVQ